MATAVPLASEHRPAASTRPEDLAATILHAFGFSPETPLYDATGRPVRASKGSPVTELFA